MAITTGSEVTKGTKRGVVVEGWEKKSGPNKGKFSVMWIGGTYPVAEDPAELQEVTNVLTCSKCSQPVVYASQHLLGGSKPGWICQREKRKPQPKFKVGDLVRTAHSATNNLNSMNPDGEVFRVTKVIAEEDSWDEYWYRGDVKDYGVWESRLELAE